VRWSRAPPSSDSTTKHNTDFVEIAVDENALLGEAVYIVVANSDFWETCACRSWQFSERVMVMDDNTNCAADPIILHGKWRTLRCAGQQAVVL